MIEIRVTAFTDAADLGSEAFCVYTKNLAAELVAPLIDSANTDEPLAARLVKALALIETNKSAHCLRALATRTLSGINTSSLRVINTFIAGSCLINALNLQAICNTMSF